MSPRRYIQWAARKTAEIARQLSGVADRPKPSGPALSIVLVAYNIPRELPRTLYSLSAAYQRHIDATDYEVIVVDNGSNPPVDPNLIAALGANFRLIRIEKASASPVPAVNRALKEARGDIIGVMIDGARIATPGLLHLAAQGVCLYPRAIVAALGWYLGYDFQRHAMDAGYDKAREDALLESIGWPQDGYRLFEISTMDESSFNGWLAPIAESNGLFLSRETWDLLGGLDERFDLPGGGLINLDTFRRAVELPDAQLVILLGEGTFHQLHGGVATNIPVDAMANGWDRWNAQYEAIRGQPYALPKPANPPTYLGTLPRPALAHFVRAALQPRPGDAAPLGAQFDAALWSSTPPSPVSNPAIGALIDLAHSELRAGRPAAAAAIARLARQRAPDELEPRRLLSLLAGFLPMKEPPADLRAGYHLALADAYRLLGEAATAAANYNAALAVEPGLARAQSGLAALGGET